MPLQYPIFLDHFQVIQGAFLDALGLDEPVFLPEEFNAVL